MAPDSKAQKKTWHRSLAERYVPPLADEWAKIGPKHSRWKERVKLEIISLAKYVQFLSSEFKIPWLQIKPDQNSKYNFMLWRGYIQIPKRPDIKFDMVILLSSEYPAVIPRCFLEENITKYTGKIYLKNQYTDSNSGKVHVMICHDHMGEVSDVWNPTLGIAHFFIREVWFWFAAMQNHIITEWDRLHNVTDLYGNI
ncbi:MAG: hypothetical protein ACTSWY_08050 [Promethearchaeota archaeon]